MRLKAHSYLSINLVFAIISSLVNPVDHDFSPPLNDSPQTDGYSVQETPIYAQGGYEPIYPGPPEDCLSIGGKECGEEGRKSRFKKSVDLIKEGNIDLAKIELENILFDYPDDQNAHLLLKTINSGVKLLIIREFGNKSFKYKMKPSETLSQVAEKFLGNKVWFYALARYNGINTPISINAGKIIRVPGKNPSPPGPAPDQVVIKNAQKASKRGNFKSAISRLENGLKKFKGHPEFIKLLVNNYIEYGENLYEKGRFNKARNLMKKARKLDRGNPKVATLLKRIQARVTKNQVKHLLVQAQKKLGDADYEGALSTLESGMVRNPGNSQLSQLAVDIYLMHSEFLLDNREFSKARENLKQARKLDRGNPKVAALLKRIQARVTKNQIQHLLVQAQKKLGDADYEGALDTLESGMVRNPGNSQLSQLAVDIYLMHSEFLLDNREFSKARDNLLQARNLDRGNPKVAALLKRIQARVTKNQIQHLLVQAQKKLGDADYEGALDTLESGMVRNPGNSQLSQLAVDIYLMHSEFLLDNREFSKARDNLLQARKLDRGNPKVAALLKRIQARVAENRVQIPAQQIYEKGLKHLKADNQLEAFVCFKKARYTNPSHKEAQKNFNQLLKKLSDKYHRNAVSAYNLEDLESAFCNWEFILKMDPNHSRAKTRRDETKKMKCRLDNLNGKSCIPIDCSKTIPTTFACGERF